MKQTTVEWLVEQLNLYGDMAFNKEISLAQYHIKKQELLEQAKEMEKQQHENTWYAGDEDGAIHEFEYYWKETYGGNKQECQFESDSNLTSATKCKWCGLEKWQHKTYGGAK
jgi:hypothetical protein